MLRVGIVGEAGKLGKQVVESIANSERQCVDAVIAHKSAVEWIADKDKGLYDIGDLFGGK